MSDDWFWRWLFLRCAESYFTWFWERYGRAWRDDSYTELIKLYVWCYLMVLQLIQSFERPDHEEMPAAVRDNRAELEGLRESFRRQIPTYDPFAAALSSGIQVDTIRQLRNFIRTSQVDVDPVRQFRDIIKTTHVDPDPVRQLWNFIRTSQIESDPVRQLRSIFKDLQVEPDTVTQLRNMFRGLDIDSVRRLDRSQDL